jgi:hypothetical protein
MSFRAEYLNTNIVAIRFIAIEFKVSGFQGFRVSGFAL